MREKIAAIAIIFWCLICMYGLSFVFHVILENWMMVWYGFATLLTGIVSTILLAVSGGMSIWWVIVDRIKKAKS